MYLAKHLAKRIQVDLEKIYTASYRLLNHLLSTGSSGSWQCPNCHKEFISVPTVYQCFCGRFTNPRTKNRRELSVPHSCESICLKSLAIGPHFNCR